MRKLMNLSIMDTEKNVVSKCDVVFSSEYGTEFELGEYDPAYSEQFENAFYLFIESITPLREDAFIDPLTGKLEGYWKIELAN